MKKRGMKKYFLNIDGDVPDEVFYEIIILYNLGVSLEELKYLLALKAEIF
jgi:hypothetical protein